ncbi:MFS transporter [Streptomyces xiamenensis]|uniref:MFS transporter n=1 Tax=Streptomyces xiamenensis TaxID=408015 RepID=UPI0036EDFC42
MTAPPTSTVPDATAVTDPDDPAGAAAAVRLPGVYRVWLAGALVSMLGTSLMFFALGWAASAHGGMVAGAVLTAVNLPRFALLLVGGALGDRAGAWRVMVAGDLAMVLVSLAVALSAWRFGAPVWLLLAAALLTGVVDAFYLPASGSMPRRLVGAAVLPRALALRQTGVQLTMFAGGSLGGVLVARAGLAGVALVQVGTFSLMLAVLVGIRGRFAGEGAGRGAGGSMLGDIADGLRLAWRDRLLRVSLGVVSVAAAFLLPVVALLVPLLAREQGWGAEPVGLVSGAQALGIVAVSLVVLRRGGAARPGVAAGVGLLVAGGGIAVLGLVASPVVAVVAGLLVGAGNGLFGAHVAPLILTAAPESHLSRVQAILTMVQTGSLLLMNLTLGAAAEHIPVGAVLAGCALAVAVTGVGALCSAPLREVRRAGVPAGVGAGVARRRAPGLRPGWWSAGRGRGGR